jgi:hypothetical protein
VSQKLWHFFSRNLNCPSILIRSCPMWHYPMCRHYPMCCPVFLMQSSPHVVIFNSLIWSPILEIFSAMNSALYFLHIYCLDFHLKKNILPSNFEKILWSNNFLKVPPCRNYFYENQDGFCFLWDLGLWILTIQPSHSYTLANCRPIHIISIEF